MGSRGDQKTSFSQAYRLLSQYLKEKGSLTDLGIHIAPLPQQPQGKSWAPTTMKLLPGADVLGEDRTDTKSSPKSMDLFPQHSGFHSGKEPLKNSDSKQTEKSTLTIFYGGKVLVFDNFPANKAEDLMQMANRESMAAQNLSFPTTPGSSPAAAAGADAASNKPDAKAAAETGSRSTAPPPPEEGLSKPNSSDMPIARRNSLHRFLEKRKDRINTNAPYHVNGSLAAAAAEAKPESSHSWLNLGRETSQPEHSSESSK
ncbi:protein TIFY 10a [Canna indica]|uniref:Protein TIFY n=1 Tax=Canna indica TaxID=4628 RepID=A0AAQ3KE66_9LILI|nr:protein TIFY 10a [Canna indica]